MASSIQGYEEKTAQEGYGELGVIVMLGMYKFLLLL